MTLAKARFGDLGLAAVVGLIAIGCGGVYDSACTLIGCIEGLAVRIVGELPESYIVHLEPPAGGPTMEFRCGPEEPCPNPRFVPNFTPVTVTVTIEGDELHHVETFTPTYTVLRPNGPDCPPECRQGAITVDVR